MITYLKSFFAIFVPLIVLDGIWLGLVAKPFYARKLGFLMTDKPVWAAVVIFYILYAIGVAYFVVVPAIAGALPWYQVLIRGAFFGLVAYATYDLTSHAIVANWPAIVTVVDIAWGMAVTGIAATVGYMILK